MDTVSSVCQKLRYSYCGRQRVGRIITPALTIGLIILVIRWASTPSSVQLPQDLGRKFAILDDEQISGFLNSMTDTRPKSCTNAKYEGLKEDSVSIILDFHEEQFYDLKLTMESIFRNTDDHLIKEVILLDDGSGTETVQRHAARYLAQERFKKVQAFRSEKSEGHSLSRFKASKVATGSILVFLSHDVAVNKGWLEPLIDSVIADRHRIVVPHFDSLLDGGRFFRTPDNLINTFSWTLDTAFMETNQEGTVLTTAVMTGDAFAVDRYFLDTIGNFDEGMDKGYGENLELSIRTWLCGGSISIRTCSRVAVRNALKPVRIHTPRNFRRIAELWLDEYKKIAYKQGEFGREGDDEAERISLQMRQQYLKKTTHCKPFKVYLKDIARDVLIPSDDAHYFGKFKSKTGYCLTNEIIENPKQESEISMVLCKPHMYSSNMVFEFDYKGRIKNSGKCVEVAEEENLVFAPCAVGRSSQIFELTNSGLISSLQKQAKCLMHATRTEGLQKVNFLALRGCPTGPLEEERDFLWSVIRY